MECMACYTHESIENTCEAKKVLIKHGYTHL
jgi:hypothetical protein